MNKAFTSQIDIPYHIVVERPDYIQYSIEAAKRQGALEIFEEIYKSNIPIVVETHMEEWDDPRYQKRCYRLHYRLTAVQMRNVTMPVFEFENRFGEREWKCPACGMINKIAATYCGEVHKHAVGCGHPREFAQ